MTDARSDPDRYTLPNGMVVGLDIEKYPPEWLDILFESVGTITKKDGTKVILDGLM